MLESTPTLPRCRVNSPTDVSQEPLKLMVLGRAVVTWQARHRYIGPYSPRYRRALHRSPAVLMTAAPRNSHGHGQLPWRQVSNAQTRKKRTVRAFTTCARLRSDQSRQGIPASCPNKSPRRAGSRRSDGCEPYRSSSSARVSRTSLRSTGPILPVRSWIREVATERTC